MRYLLLTTSIVLGSLLFAGCGQEGFSPAEGERVLEEESPIIGGSLDTTHQAVVAVLGNYGGNSYECSGTVVQVKNGIGYVLTAAHCCPPGMPPNEVIIGPDYNAGVSHPIVPSSIYKDTCYLDYAGSTDDICLLRFSGANAATQVIQVATPPDVIVVGTPITYVGYGLTNNPYIPDPNNPGQVIANPNVGNNSLRHKVSKTVSKVDTYFVEYANAGQSGTCQGDSGGPGLITVGGVEKVASVTSFGDQACSQLGSSIRTSSVYTHVIEKYLADQAPAPVCPAAVDCNACSQSATQNGNCVNVTNACFKDAECSALVQCYQSCSSTSCIAGCNNAHVDGLTKYASILDCVCISGCPQACGNTPTCTAPKCGLKVVDTTCASCIEKTCCAEAWECQSDTTCKKCFTTSTAPAACAANAKAAAYYTCAKDQCACAVNDPALAGGTIAASSGAATTGSGETTSGGAGGSGGDAGTTVAGVGGAAATAGAGGSGNSGGVQVGGCACSTADSGRGTAGPFAALALGTIGIVARRRRRAR